MPTALRLGIQLCDQAATWPEYLAAARRVDALGYDHLWSWDHLYAISGDPYQAVLDPWMTLAGWAMATDHVRLGLLVGANTLHNPAVVAKRAATLDHFSGGRAILGLGAGWFELEHRAHGIGFGTGDGQRLDWLDEAAAACRALLDGSVVTSGEGAHYRFDALVGLPTPVQPHLPLLIGGAGERKTLRTVARYADMWNWMGTPEVLAHKDAVLREHCAAIGRDQTEIERTVIGEIIIRDDPADARRAWAACLERNRTLPEQSDGPDCVWLGTPEQIAAEIGSRAAVGFRTVICQMFSPFDIETIERLIGEVRPLVEADWATGSAPERLAPVAVGS